jgi:RNA polymerase sigma factor (sigma-70 family)
MAAAISTSHILDRLHPLHIMRNWELTEESLGLFLSWLDADREAAAEKYEDIRRRLIAMFDFRGCACSEDLADETINRFIRRLPAMIDSYDGDPIPYLYTVARHLHSDYVKKRPQPLPANLAELRRSEEQSEGDEERTHGCLERCLEKLEPKGREMVIAYYQGVRQGKIDFRKELAEQLGIAANALRIRMHRIRAALHKCVIECLAAD